MSVESLIKKRRQIRAAWDQEKIPSKELIYSLLEKAFDLAPSKQNLFPFKIHVIEPDNDEDHKSIAGICALWDKGSVNNWNLNDEEAYEKSRATNRRAPWVLVFEQRRCEPNQFVLGHCDKNEVDMEELGIRFSQCHPTRYKNTVNLALAAIEVGMYTKVLGSLCLEQDLAISYIKSFPEWVWREREDFYWKETNKVGYDWSRLPYITERPLLVVQIGYKAEMDDPLASNSVNPDQPYWEDKPSMDTVVAFHSGNNNE